MCEHGVNEDPQLDQVCKMLSGNVVGDDKRVSKIISEALVQRGDVQEAMTLIHKAPRALQFPDRESLTFAIQERPEWTKDLESSLHKHGRKNQMIAFAAATGKTPNYYPFGAFYVDQVNAFLNHRGMNNVAHRFKTDRRVTKVSPVVISHLFDKGMTINSEKEFERLVDIAISDRTSAVDVLLLDRMIDMCRRQWPTTFMQGLMQYSDIWDLELMSRYVNLSLPLQPRKMVPHKSCPVSFEVIKAGECVFLKNFAGLDMSRTAFYGIMDKIAECDPETKIIAHSETKTLALARNKQVVELMMGNITQQLKWHEVLELMDIERTRMLCHLIRREAPFLFAVEHIFYRIQVADTWEHIEEIVDMVFEPSSEGLRLIYNRLKKEPTSMMRRNQRICVSKCLSKLSQ